MISKIKNLNQYDPPKKYLGIFYLIMSLGFFLLAPKDFSAIPPWKIASSFLFCFVFSNMS